MEARQLEVLLQMLLQMLPKAPPEGAHVIGRVRSEALPIDEFAHHDLQTMFC